MQQVSLLRVQLWYNSSSISTLQNCQVPQPGHKHGSLNSATNSPQSHGAVAPTEEVNITDEDSRIDAADLEPNIYVAKVKAEPTKAFSASTSLPGFHPFPTPTCTCISEMDGKDDTRPPESDEVLLSIYRTRLSPQFPFVIVPDSLTALELQRSRPFLAKAIIMVASLRHRQSMWNQNRLLLRQISESIFMGPERSLDLLQSVIVFLGFFQYFCFAHGNFSSLAHLASSMIADMRLDRPRDNPGLRNKSLQGIDPEEPRAMLNDERRAVLAVWYLNSSFAVGFKKVNSPSRHFTTHMERQLQELQGGLEYETDKVLAQLICAQRMNEMIAQVQQGDQMVDVQPSLRAWTAKFDSLLVDLDNLRVSESEQKPHRYMVSSHRNFAQLQLLEPQLLDADHFQNQEAIAALQHTPDYFRTPSISKKEAADIALRAWFEDWLTIPVCHFFYLPMSAYSHLTNATVILLRRARLVLLTCYRQGDPYVPKADMNLNAGDFPRTDSGGSSNDLMLDLLDRLASRFEQARVEMAAAHCSEWANNLLDLIAWKLRERKTCIEKWIKVIANQAHANSQSGAEVAGDSYRPGEQSGYNGDLAAFQALDEPSLWLDPLEALLMGNGDAYESWL
ncbi:Transcription factor himD [Paramyrothecium foliicola]|nr:Transcription factor himD [Paramyrothecium foliicola]